MNFGTHPATELLIIALPRSFVDVSCACHFRSLLGWEWADRIAQGPAFFFGLWGCRVGDHPYWEMVINPLGIEKYPSKDSHGMGWLIFICLTWLESDPSSVGHPPVSFRCEPICRWSANDVCRRQSAEGPWRILISNWVGVHFWKSKIDQVHTSSFRSTFNIFQLWRNTLW